MPEFILNTEGAGGPWESLDAFTQGFIATAFFCEVSQISKGEWNQLEIQESILDGTSDGSIPSDASVADISRDSFCDVVNFCQAFQERAKDLLSKSYNRAGYSEERAGSDLYFTYAGHGVGYWDRSELDEDELGNKLSSICGYGAINLYVGDALHIHFDID